MNDIVTEGIISTPAASYLSQCVSGLEKSMADVDGERLIGTYAEIIIDQWDPYAICYNNLPYLAYAMGALLWEEGWSESTQREWTAKQFEYKSLRGTQDGIAMALHYSGRDFVGPTGYEITQAIRPPQSFFASPSLTKEQYDFWIHLMPELRITFYEGVGWDGEDVLFCDDGGAGWFVGLDDGPALHGRKAFLRVKGKDIPLEIYTFTKTVNGVTSVDYERVALPGLAGLRLHHRGLRQRRAIRMRRNSRAATCHGAHRRLVQPRRVATASRYGVPGMDPIDVRYERNSDIGWGN